MPLEHQEMQQLPCAVFHCILHPSLSHLLILWLNLYQNQNPSYSSDTAEPCSDTRPADRYCWRTACIRLELPFHPCRHNMAEDVRWSAEFSPLGEKRVIKPKERTDLDFGRGGTWLFKVGGQICGCGRCCKC